MSTSRFGLAVGREGVWAVPLGRRGTRSGDARVIFRPLGGDSTTAVRSALKSVLEELDVEGATAYVTLLPSLAKQRELELPRLNPRKLRRVLTRYAGRYFFGVREPQIVGGVARRGARRSPARGSPARVTAAAAPLAAVEEILSVLQDAHADVGSVTTAYDAWCGMVCRLARSYRHGVVWIVVCLDESVEVIRCVDGTPQRVRRMSADALGESHLTQILKAEFAVADTSGRLSGGSKPVVVLGEGEGADALSEQVRTAGGELIRVTSHDGFDSPYGMAAAGAAFVPSGIELLPERIHDARRARSRRATAGLAAAAVAVFALAAGLEYQGARRDLAALIDRRAEIAEAVDRAMAERSVWMDLNDRLEALASLEQSAPQWSLVLSRVADYLPEDAHLTAFRGRADSLSLEGIANRAAGVFEAMQNAPGVLGVRAQAPIRRELRNGEEPIERFTLAARLAPRSPEDTSQ